MKEGIKVELFEAGQEEPLPLRCAGVPRIGEYIRFNDYRYLVTGVEHVSIRDWGEPYVRIWTGQGQRDQQEEIEEEVSDAG